MLFALGGLLAGCATVRGCFVAVEGFVAESKRKKGQRICINLMEVREVILRMLGKDQNAGIFCRA